MKFCGLKFKIKNCLHSTEDDWITPLGIKIKLNTLSFTNFSVQ
jgi:hypothetical protein